VLRIHGHAHTYAFLSLPLSGAVRGLVVKLRQGSDEGMSWGPAALVRFDNGARLRIGTRADGRLQADMTARPLPGAEWPAAIPAQRELVVPGIRDQQLLAEGYDPQRWVWLRARWGAYWGVIEASDDGERYRTLWRFEHDGNFSAGAQELLVGKVPYNGRAEDFSTAGPLGDCEIGLAQVY